MRRPFVALVREALTSMLRDRTALFFTYALPLIFLVIFGLLFRGTNSFRPEVLAVGDGAITRGLPSEALKVTPAADPGRARARVADGKAAAVISQVGDEVRVDYAAADPTTAATVLGIVRASVDQANLRDAGVRNPRFRVRATQVEDRSLSSVEFYVPGLLGYGVSVSAVFGLALTVVQWRRSGLLRRLHLTPMRVWHLALSRVVAATVIAVTQTVLFLVVGAVLFGVKPSGAWWMAFPLVAIGAVAFLSIGFAVAAFAKTQEAASALANVITLPMAFLGGAFVPLDTAPHWLRVISRMLPLTYLTDGLKDVMVRGHGPAAAVVPAAVLVGFALVVGLVGVRVFRWE